MNIITLPKYNNKIKGKRCTVCGEDAFAHLQGVPYCRRHYLQMKRGGIKERTTRDPNELIDLGASIKIVLYNKSGQKLEEFGLVDDEDITLVQGKKVGFGKFGEKKYCYVSEKGKITLLHRYVWEKHNGKIPSDKVVDHINGNGLDCRKENLRLASSLENSYNLSKPNKFTGVNPTGNRFNARIMHDRKDYNLGTFPTLKEALNARIEAERRYFGSFGPNVSRYDRGLINYSQNYNFNNNPGYNYYYDPRVMAYLTYGNMSGHYLNEIFKGNLNNDNAYYKVKNLLVGPYSKSLTGLYNSFWGDKKASDRARKNVAVKYMTLSGSGLNPHEYSNIYSYNPTFNMNMDSHRNGAYLEAAIDAGTWAIPGGTLLKPLKPLSKVGFVKNVKNGAKNIISNGLKNHPKVSKLTKFIGSGVVGAGNIALQSGAEELIYEGAKIVNEVDEDSLEQFLEKYPGIASQEQLFLMVGKMNKEARGLDSGITNYEFDQLSKFLQEENFNSLAKQAGNEHYSVDSSMVEAFGGKQNNYLQLLNSYYKNNNLMQSNKLNESQKRALELYAKYNGIIDVDDFEQFVEYVAGKGKLNNGSIPNYSPLPTHGSYSYGFGPSSHERLSKEFKEKYPEAYSDFLEYRKNGGTKIIEDIINNAKGLNDSFIQNQTGYVNIPIDEISKRLAIETIRNGGSINFQQALGQKKYNPQTSRFEKILNPTENDLTEIQNTFWARGGRNLFMQSLNEAQNLIDNGLIGFDENGNIFRRTEKGTITEDQKKILSDRLSKMKTSIFNMDKSNEEWLTKSGYNAEEQTKGQVIPPIKRNSAPQNVVGSNSGRLSSELAALRTEGVESIKNTNTASEVQRNVSENADNKEQILETRKTPITENEKKIVSDSSIKYDNVNTGESIDSKNNLLPVGLGALALGGLALYNSNKKKKKKREEEDIDEYEE